ncbi:hypothetical protein SDC9_169859 [bioreactor metagenome]|uniref:Uncharacterized protein n=1 Tax=bioreactor metagenome TaxID=1076179 RepID=A0A645G8M4_9ZZZZ
MLHELLILPPVGLGPQGMDGRPLAPVEHPVLNAGPVRGPGHFAAQGVDFPHQVTLAGAADGGVAGHVAHRVQIDGEHHGAQAQPGGGQRRFDSRVARADHCDIKLSGMKFSHGQSSKKSLSGTEIIAPAAASEPPPPAG